MHSTSANIIEKGNTIMKTLEMMKAKLEEAAVAAVECANNEESSDELLKQAKTLVNDRLLAYNKKAADDAYTMWAAQPNSVVEALKTLYVPQALKCRIFKDKKTGKFKYELKPNADLKIDLWDMMSVVGAEKFQDRAWYGACQKAVFIIAGNLSKELGNSKDFTNLLDEAGKAFNFAPDANLSSNNSCLKAMQFIVNAIVPEESRKGDLEQVFTLKKYQWVYVREALTKHAGTGKIAMGDTSKIIELIEDVLYCALNDIKLELLA